MKSANAVTLIAGALATAAASAAEPVAYPEDYRQWTHVKSMTIHEGHPLEAPFLGIHHIYANPAALKGLEKDRYEDGAVFVFDQLEYATEGKTSTEGPRVLLGIMVKDAKKFADTGGWGFEGWAGDSRNERLVSDGGQSCFGCHTQVKDQEYVFTRWRD